MHARTRLQGLGPNFLERWRKNLDQSGRAQLAALLLTKRGACRWAARGFAPLGPARLQTYRQIGWRSLVSRVRAWVENRLRISSVTTLPRAAASSDSARRLLHAGSGWDDTGPRASVFAPARAFLLRGLVYAKSLDRSRPAPVALPRTSLHIPCHLVPFPASPPLSWAWACKSLADSSPREKPCRGHTLLCWFHSL